MFQRGGFCLTRRKPLALACICGRSYAIKRGRVGELIASRRIEIRLSLLGAVTRRAGIFADGL
jgi:hypothetical protein